ncbi:putative DNA-binding domain, KAT8 regulatory NSL complex subunit 2 [Helianthus debilis subsp. tardiflorus]
MDPPPSHHPFTTKITTNSASIIKQSPEDEYLSNSTHLSRQQVLNRRSHNMQQLSKCYRDHYWGLMEEIRVRYREYLWKFGVSPFQDDCNEDEKVRDGIDDAIVVAGDVTCVFNGCKTKAMTLTSYCHVHILSDPKQQLYKPCEFLLKSVHAELVPCGKPVLRSIVPSLCSIHYLKAQQHVVRALRKAGLNITSMNKSGPKFHVVVTEYVREIQEKRKKNGSMANKKKIVPKLEIEN